MSRVEVTQVSTPLSDGILQTDLPIGGTPQVVKDQLGNSSTLLLANDETQINSTLRVHTDSAELLDLEDTGNNNRFNINRDVQKINLDFASKPSDLTTIVGAIRTATDGTNLADVMEFQENGNSAILKNLGVGNLINTTGFGQKIRAIGQGDASIGIYRNQGSSFPAKLEFMKSRGTYDVPTVVSANDQIANVGFYGYTGSAYAQSAAINTTALSASTGVEGTMKFVIYNNTGSNFDKLGIYKEGVYIGDAVAVPSSQLQIKGKGATAATNSLLIQNSSGTTLMSIRDDGATNIGNAGSGQGLSAVNLTVSGGGGSSYIASQGVAHVFGGLSSTSSAIVQCESTTKGFLPPRMTTAQKNAIAAPAAGLMVYDTTLNKLCVYTTVWETITSI